MRIEIDSGFTLKHLGLMNSELYERSKRPGLRPNGPSLDSFVLHFVKFCVLQAFDGSSLRSFA